MIQYLQSLVPAIIALSVYCGIAGFFIGQWITPSLPEFPDYSDNDN